MAEKRESKPTAAKDALSKRLQPPAWRKQERGDIWRPETEGETLVGVILSVRDGQFGKRIRVETEDGIRLLPAHVVLMDRLMDAEARPGVVIKAVCTKVGSERRGDYFDYEVFVGESEVA